MSETLTETWKHLEGQVVDEKFHLRRYLGGTENGAVFLTEYGELEPQKAAIKLIPADPENAELQLSRWGQAASLSHPHLLRIFHSGRCTLGDVRMLYAVMECAEEDLSQIIPQRSLTPSETQDMLGPVLDALAYLRGKGLVHGHIKPANIMAVGEQLKISSDGICAAGESRNGRNKPSVYDAPEIGTRGNSAAGDVWSLGVTLVEVLTQQLPAWEWKGQEEPALPKAMPAPFGDVARQCLRRDPQLRWTLADIAARLQPDSQPAQTAAPARVKKPQRDFTKPSYAIPAIAIGVAALVVIFAVPKMLRQSAEVSTDADAAAEQPTPKTSPEHAPAKTEVRTPAEKSSEKKSTSAGAAATPAAVPAPARVKAEAKKRAVFVKGAVAHQVLPDPPLSARDTISGTVRTGVRVQVDSAGSVIGSSVDYAGPSKYFANLAMSVARYWKFTPPQMDGENVSSEWVLRFEFAQNGTKVTPVEAAPTENF